MRRVWRQMLGDWPVSGPACEIATSALRDTDWIAATRKRLAADRKRLDEVLGQAGLKLLGGTDLFGLFEAPDEVDLLDHFARAGILVRGFAERVTAIPVRASGRRGGDGSGCEAACATLR